MSSKAGAVAAPSAAPRQVRIRRERILMVAAVVVLLAAAWIVGYLSNDTEVAAYVGRVLPGAKEVSHEDGLFIGRDAAGTLIGYAAVGQGQGYGGPIEVLVGVDPAGQILGTTILEQRESPGFFRLVTGQELPEQFVNRQIDDPLRLNVDVDAVSGATVSAEGVALAVREAVRQIAVKGLDRRLPPEPTPIEFGWPEVTLIGLFVVGYVGHRWRNRTWKPRVRWGALLVGLVVLGFVYTAPLTIAMVTALLSGYWPDWRSHLYWYLLMGGILFVTTVHRKNPYCYWFCPFGAFQECLAKVSGAKLYRPRRWRQLLLWAQRGLAVSAIALGLALRRPGVASFEPFGTLFDLRGTPYEWALLTLVVVASLLMYRPFCNFLCPLDPLIDFIGAGRRWLVETWNERK